MGYSYNYNLISLSTIVIICFISEAILIDELAIFIVYTTLNFTLLVVGYFGVPLNILECLFCHNVKSPV